MSRFLKQIYATTFRRKPPVISYWRDAHRNTPRYILRRCPAFLVASLPWRHIFLLLILHGLLRRPVAYYLWSFVIARGAATSPLCGEWGCPVSSTYERNHSSWACCARSSLSRCCVRLLRWVGYPSPKLRVHERANDLGMFYSEGRSASLHLITPGYQLQEKKK